MTRIVPRLAVTLALIAGTALAQAPAPQQAPPPPTAPQTPAAAGAGQGNAGAPQGAPNMGQAVREFLGLGPKPDAEAAKRGAALYASNCGFCHGPSARGAEGPSLIYSELVLKDVHGNVLVDFLRAGRPEKGMPSFATFSDAQRIDVAEFLHQQVEDVANRGNYQVKNIVLGDAAKGKVYVAKNCLGCHSLSGDLRGLGEKWRPVDLQRNWIMPPRTPADGKRAITATVSGADGKVSGRVVQLDDFRVVLVNAAGETVLLPRAPGSQLELHDPLAPHVAMIGHIADADMINVTAYLESLK